MAFDLLSSQYNGYVRLREMAFSPSPGISQNTPTDSVYTVGTRSGLTPYSTANLSNYFDLAGSSGGIFNRPSAVGGTPINTNLTMLLNSTHLFQPTTIEFGGTGAGATSTSNHTLEGQDPSSLLWVSLYSDTLTRAASTFITFDVSTNRQFSGFRVRWSTGTGPSGITMNIYGTLSRKDGQLLSDSFKIPGVIRDLSGVDLLDSSVGDNIPVDSSFLQLQQKTRDITFESFRQTLSGDFTVPNDNFVVNYNLNPGGVNRNVILPDKTFVGRTHNIINLTPAVNSLLLRETVGGPIIATISTTTSSSRAECIWSGSTWLVTVF